MLVEEKFVFPIKVKFSLVIIAAKKDISSG